VCLDAAEPLLKTQLRGSMIKKQIAMELRIAAAIAIALLRAYAAPASLNADLRKLVKNNLVTGDDIIPTSTTAACVTTVLNRCVTTAADLVAAFLCKTMEKTNSRSSQKGYVLEGVGA
jgi:hypothetical protein